MADSNSKYRIVTGDLNAKNGTKTKEEGFKSMGAFGIEERNEREGRVVEKHKLIRANTLLQKPKSKNWTWESPDGETRNQTDFALCIQRGIVTNCEVVTEWQE